MIYIYIYIYIYISLSIYIYIHLSLYIYISLSLYIYIYLPTSVAAPMIASRSSSRFRRAKLNNSNNKVNSSNNNNNNSIIAINVITAFNIHRGAPLLIIITRGPGEAPCQGLPHYRLVYIWPYSYQHFAK